MKSFSNLRLFALFSIFLIPLSALSAKDQGLPKDIGNKLSAYNVVWDTPSTNGSMSSMPLGNGDITSNVWVEDNGDLMLYIGKSDCWSEATRLLKIGRLRISVTPNPFVNPTQFSQALILENGEIRLDARNSDLSVNLRIWIDANRPVLHIDGKTSKNVRISCTSEIMRREARTFEGGGSNPLSSSYRGLMDSPTSPSESADIIADIPGRIEWYHHNQTSFFATILKKQNVGELTAKYKDPYLGRIFGAAVTGRDMENANDTTLVSIRPTKEIAISLTALTGQYDNPGEWQSELNRLVATTEKTPLKEAYRQHCKWWNDFWNRSWIFLSGNDNARKITQGYLLQRYMMACQSRGAYPVKFNGGTLTFDYQGKNGDYRNWGPGYWYQNCRLYHWPMTASGDFDLKKPWFDMYMNMLPLQCDVTKKYYGHEGAFFPETLNFFGLYIQDDWGWNNPGKASQTRWIRYHYEGALEMLAEMIDYYEHTKDTDFAENYVVPFATQVIRFFDQHWPTINNQYRFIPANALEQFWDCLNPIDYISGLTYDINCLKKLPEGIVSTDLLTEWENCLAKLPPIPKSGDGSRLLPAEEYSVDRNFENPQCYAIFPFRLYGKKRPDYDVAMNTFRDRKFKMSNCWSQCAIQAAALGLDTEMENMLMHNASATDPEIRFPAFWKPGSDYIPDFDNGGVLATALQLMLLDNIDDSIILLQAMPDNWSVDFKLHANDNTTVRAVADGKNVKKLEVFPLSREKDIVLP